MKSSPLQCRLIGRSGGVASIFVTDAHVRVAKELKGGAK